MSMDFRKNLISSENVMINDRIKNLLLSSKPDIEEFERIRKDLETSPADLDKLTLCFLASIQIGNMMDDFAHNIKDAGKLRLIIDTIKAVRNLSLEPDFWKVKKIASRLQKRCYESLQRRQYTDPLASGWCRNFNELLLLLNLQDEDNIFNNKMKVAFY